MLCPCSDTPAKSKSSTSRSSWCRRVVLDLTGGGVERVAPLSRKLWWAPGEILAAISSANQRAARPRLPHRSFLIFFPRRRRRHSAPRTGYHTFDQASTHMTSYPNPTQPQDQPEKKKMSAWVWVVGLGATAFFVRLPYHLAMQLCASQ
jgi:hypothetical protein